MRKWYHVSNFEGSEILFINIEEEPYRYDGNYYGPFETFTKAKKDAIEYHTATKWTAIRAIRDIKEVKKGDIK